MTKRTLLIIIGLLVLLDVAAIIIYLAGTKNHDGKSPLDFTIDRSNVVTSAEYRRKGLASACLDYARELAKKRIATN